jgi:hypothetical protein
MLRIQNFNSGDIKNFIKRFDAFTGNLNPQEDFYQISDLLIVKIVSNAKDIFV